MERTVKLPWVLVLALLGVSIGGGTSAAVRYVSPEPIVGLAAVEQRTDRIEERVRELELAARTTSEKLDTIGKSIDKIGVQIDSLNVKVDSLRISPARHGR